MDLRLLVLCLALAVTVGATSGPHSVSVVLVGATGSLVRARKVTGSSNGGARRLASTSGKRCSTCMRAAASATWFCSRLVRARLLSYFAAQDFHFIGAAREEHAAGWWPMSCRLSVG